MHIPASAKIKIRKIAKLRKKHVRRKILFYSTFREYHQSFHFSMINDRVKHKMVFFYVVVFPMSGCDGWKSIHESYRLSDKKII